MLKDFFADKGKVLSAKLSEAPGTSKSRRFGFVSFSSEEDVEAAILSLNNAVSLLLCSRYQKLGFLYANSRTLLIISLKQMSSSLDICMQ